MSAGGLLITAVVAPAAAILVSALKSWIARSSDHRINIRTPSGKALTLELDNLSSQDIDKLASALSSAAQGNTEGLETVAAESHSAETPAVAQR